MTVTKTITTRANQKPWMTAEVHGLLKARDEAFRSGDKAALKTARANLSRGIKNAKRSYAQKINNHFTDSRDTRSLWQAIQTITDYKPPPQACDDDLSLPAGRCYGFWAPWTAYSLGPSCRRGGEGGLVGFPLRTDHVPVESPSVEIAIAFSAEPCTRASNLD